MAGRGRKWVCNVTHCNKVMTTDKEKPLKRIFMFYCWWKQEMRMVKLKVERWIICTYTQASYAWKRVEGRKSLERDAGVDTSNKHHHPHHNEIVVLLETYYQEGTRIRRKSTGNLLYFWGTIAHCPEWAMCKL